MGRVKAGVVVRPCSTHLEGSWTLRSTHGSAESSLNEPAFGTMKHLMVASRTRIQADVVATGSRWRCLQFLSSKL